MSRLAWEVVQVVIVVGIIVVVFASIVISILEL